MKRYSLPRRQRQDVYKRQIDKGFVAFTTTNPEMRYIRMGNVKGTNNLRDFYYRDIVLGEQNEQVYNHTNNFEIALAFREAGEAIGS